jgi:obg-like ATPase 1
MENKKKTEEKTVERPILGRISSHLKMGIVGLPNVGKSSLFNLMTKCEVKAENFPFCTIDPNVARVQLPDERFNWLCEHYLPKSKVPSALEVVDIAGLVPGAHEGAGLGNAFLSHIGHVDGIYHMVRIFADPDIVHTEGELDPIRDLNIISNELRLKDLDIIKKRRAPLARAANTDPTKRPELAFMDKVIQILEEGKDIRNIDWNAKEVEFLQEQLMLTAKPVTVILNMSEKDYLRQANKWIKPIFAWVAEHSPGSKIIPVSVSLEQKIFPMTPEQREDYFIENKTKSKLSLIIQAGFESIQLVNFFTCGEDEVRAWPVMKGSLAPRAAGVIHSDFEKCFIKAEVMKYNDLKELGNELAVKGAGKYRMQGKTYVVEDGDILFIKHNAKK